MGPSGTWQFALTNATAWDFSVLTGHEFDGDELDVSGRGDSGVHFWGYEWGGGGGGFIGCGGRSPGGKV